MRFLPKHIFCKNMIDYIVNGFETSPVKLPWWPWAGHFVIQNGETAYKMMFSVPAQLCPNIDNHLSKKLMPYKMAWLEKRNFIPSHPKAMSKTKMTKYQITTKWHDWNVPVLQKTPPLEKTVWFYGILVPNHILQNGVFRHMCIHAYLCLRLSWSDLHALETNYLIQVENFRPSKNGKRGVYSVPVLQVCDGLGFNDFGTWIFWDFGYLMLHFSAFRCRKNKYI